MNFIFFTMEEEITVVLNTAYSGKAKYIISGDRHLLALKEFKGIKIVTVNEMLKLLKQKRVTAQ